ncbi:trypsin-like serine protease, partial [Acinetobacter baumannii]
RSVTRIVTHPSYDPALDDNDIALLQLSQSVTINNPVMLATPATDAAWAGAGQVVTATGWGNTNATGTANYPSRLQQVDLAVTSQSSCNTAYGGDIT